MCTTTNSNIERYSLNWFKKQILKIVKQGPIPKHVGFIMDGNRRYAKKMNMPKIKGHMQGFEKAMETIYWWKYLEITNVTLYMFSIDNFKRSKEEVDAIINFAVLKYQEILDNIHQFNENEICIRLIGNYDLIPEKLRKLMCEVYLKTKHNNRFFLNIAFAYTSRDEITNAMKVVSSNKNEKILTDEVNMDLLNDLMYTADIPKLDILIRTSGEVRLSDFMLWQSSYTQIFFVGALWPELNIWHFVHCILQYQIHVKTFKETEKLIEGSETNKRNEKIEWFLENEQKNRLNKIQSFV